MKAIYIVMGYSPAHSPSWVVRDVNRQGDSVAAFCFTKEDAEKVAVALNQFESNLHRGE